MSLSDLLTVQISIESAGLVGQGFGKPGIFGFHTRFAERHRTYSSLAAMVGDGFELDDPEYIAAQVLISQKKRPASWLVGRRGAAVAQVDHINLTGSTDGVYSFTLNGEVVTFTAAGSTTAQIRDGLIAAVIALTGAGAPITAVLVDADSLSLTADIAGIPFTVGSLVAPAPATIARVSFAANVGIEADLDAVEAADGAWYATILAGNAAASASGRTPEVILRAAVWHESHTEPQRHLFFAQTNQASAPLTAYDSVTPDDIAEQLRALGYSRTVLTWHDDNDEYVDAAWAGRMLPEDPGSEVWIWKELVGVTPSALSQSQRENLIGPPRSGPGGKFANVYYALNDQTSRTARGTTSNGTWVDLKRYVDSMWSRMMINTANFVLKQDQKAPYTTKGIEGIVAQVRGVLESDSKAGKLAPVVNADGELVLAAYTITPPALADIADASRKARVLPAITFTAHVSGAIQELDIIGTVSQ